MAWLTHDPRTGADLTQFNIHGGGSIPSYLLQSHNLGVDLAKTLGPALKDYMDRKRADEIANTLANMENPPRAEAVDQYGATYDPALAKSQGLNSPTEPMATAPQTGGAQWMKANQLYQAYQRQQAADQAQSLDEYWKNKEREAKANKDQNEADDGSPGVRGKVPITLPDGTTAYVTGNAALDYYNTPGGRKSGVSDVPGVPQNVYRNSKKQSAFNPAQAFRDWQAENQNGGTLPAPDLPPTTTTDATPPTKQLDPQTAQAILSEAGGDKEKARQLARDRGYSF